MNETENYGTKGQREDLLAAYLLGEMTPLEREDFEKQLRDDPGLQTELQAWKETLGSIQEWADSQAPGSERTAELEIPKLRDKGPLEMRSRRSIDKRVQGTLIKVAAAAALFVFGFTTGQGFRSVEGTKTPAQLDRPVKSESLPEIQHPVDTEDQERTADAVKMAKARRYASRQNGHVIIDTSLSRSGSQALWVVDGSFEIDEKPLSQ